MERRQLVLYWVLGSAAAMIVSAFAPWAKFLGFTVQGTDGNGGVTLILAAAIGGGVFLWKRTTRRAGIWVLIAGALGVFIALYNLNDVNRLADVGEAFGQDDVASTGWGLYLALLASASLGAAGIVWYRLFAPPAPAPEAPAAVEQPPAL
jgi:hypothetical protein